MSLTGSLTEPHTPSIHRSRRSSTRLIPAATPVPSETVMSVMVSVPPFAVWNLNESAIVAEPPGASVAFDGSVPVASVVTLGDWRTRRHDTGRGVVPVRVLRESLVNAPCRSSGRKSVHVAVGALTTHATVLDPIVFPTV